MTGKVKSLTQVSLTESMAAQPDTKSPVISSAILEWAANRCTFGRCLINVVFRKWIDAFRQLQTQKLYGSLSPCSLRRTSNETMTAPADHFQASASAQGRIKIPGVFWAGLKSIGLSPGTVLRSSNLPPTVHSGETYLTTAQIFAVWRAIRELSNDPTVGWKFMTQAEKCRAGSS